MKTPIRGAGYPYVVPKGDRVEFDVLRADTEGTRAFVAVFITAT